jgi:hypothetical protein
MNWFNIASVVGVLSIIMFLGLRVSAPKQGALYATVRTGDFDRWTRVLLVPLIVLVFLGPHVFKVAAGVGILAISSLSILLQHRRLLLEGFDQRFVRRLSVILVIGQIAVLALIIGVINGE